MMAGMTLNNMQIHYEERGEEHQPALLLIHGLGCSLKYWACVFDAEELRHYRILALDLPGFGMSAKPETYDYSLYSQAELVAEFLQTLGIRRLSVVGHSMGGAIAIMLAHNYPQLVRQLLVIEPNLNADDAHLSRDVIRYSEAAFIQRYEEFRQIAVATVQEWFVNSHRADIESYISELLKTTPISIYRSALSLMTVTADDTLLKQFQHLALHKHFLIGENTMKTRSLPEEFQESNVETVVVPGVGHMMMVDDPRLFNRTLASVLQ